MKNSLPADTYLLSQMQANDELALLKLMKKYDCALFRYIDARIQSAENAQEAVQDIFITLWNNRFTVNIIDSLSPYLYKAAKNKVVDHYITADREIVNYEALLPEYNNEVAPAADTGIMTAELQDWLSSEVDKMPDTVKSVFRLSRQEHLPVKDIARQLSLSEQTVKNNLTIAIKRLRIRFTGMEGASVMLLLIKALFTK
ncbi:sigma-70 family RNA polymerase sigma factor [Mucilaginibacter sp. JRF]|uniref:RNA polymerase sigma factor n=1 Tax=Mucilaginibacter sp. JRF TaxID=2780088 RepID=UPI001881FD90|nr:sigma-70 family RNA polymerase sigma factor [Mucilaginibacter sp. JRF]MBE9585836.1 sigma-70 family RNA polymerase sigma factor [Mucilaginibacter sp. JRF]